jgi:hypothetical protein
MHNKTNNIGRAAGRGKGNGGKSNNNDSSQPSSTKERKFHPFVPGNTSRATYASVKDAIVLHFEKLKQHDVATSIKDMSKFVLVKPARVVSANTSAERRKVEPDGFDIDYTGDMNEYRRSKRDLDDGLIQAYSIILSDFCTKKMKEKVEDQSDFTSKIENDTIELLRAISTLSNSDTNSQYPLVDWIEQLSRFLNLKQGSDESLSEYSKRFSQELDSFKSLFGRKIFDTACEKLEDYATASITADKTKIKKDAFDAFTSIMFMKNSDQRKYGSLLQTLETDFSLGTDKYPKTKEKALDAVSNHPFDQ